MSVVEILMNSLLSRLVDSSHVVRKFCIRGLGNISSVEDSQVTFIRMARLNFCCYGKGVDSFFFGDSGSMHLHF